ncbi:FkbM family methyltransferase [Microcoleus sp. FACHB-SPT15]|uniref:FkbM family methyltransferase n=1 Tax=Microcoleus sp. FACHB-SPT15 TaxID=2692830 RepID=UPI00177DC77D|nr:FkbM family methyltransferase [Microcoleus sp. FACHB-SPT15]MBD1804149.1 FkbM family methyltransferase [Microcoleus sp. FACHB-SPT15]
MQLINYLNRPEYIFRPRQIYQRLLRSRNPDNKLFKNVLLPWGVNLKISLAPGEVVGHSVWAMGIYDLIVTEVLWRLIDPGETVIDVGVNIGYMATIMAKRVGETGHVWCFEPNPEVYQELSENIKNWQTTLGWNHIYAHKIALSNHSGEAVLSVPMRNREEASLISPQDVAPAQASDDIFKTYTVSLEKLDNVLKTRNHIGLIKIDVEGHELEVLQGAINLITAQQIRDIIFEDHNGYPSSVSQFLEDHGYTIFRIWKGFWKPLLESPTKKLIHPWEPPSYLATKDSSRARERLKKRGWNSLQSQN